MGAKDHSEKLLEDYEDVFADIVNVLAFQGERLLQEENILPGPTESIYKDEQEELRQQIRDVLKYDRDEKTTFSVIGLENQSTVNREMVFRVMKYDAVSYQNQIDSREDRHYPVFTLVLHFGMEHWNAPKTIVEALALDEIPYGKYIPGLLTDAKLNVIEVAFLTEEVRKQFTSDFRIVADYFCAAREGDEVAFLKDERAFKHVEAMLDFFSTFTSDKRYQEYKKPLLEEQEKGVEISMCKLLDYAEGKGMERGMEQGMERGMKKMAMEMLKNHEPYEKIARYAQVSVETVKAWAEDACCKV
ncbi:MAG: Rpn family recombination-promoting nuclease/putative transposase [Hungatella sp.]